MRVRQRTMQDLGAGRIKHAIFLAPDNQRRRRQSHHVLLQMRYFGGEVAEDPRMQVVVMRRGDRQFMRSEERRVGNEGVSTCRYRGRRDPSKKNTSRKNSTTSNADGNDTIKAEILNLHKLHDKLDINKNGG